MEGRDWALYLEIGFIALTIAMIALIIVQSIH